MLPKKTTKAMKAKAKFMTKTGLAQALADSTEMKKALCMKIVNSLMNVGREQVKSVGKFKIPGLCMVKTRLKPATQAGERQMFGKTIIVKAKPAKTVVKAFPIAALKKSI